MTVQEQIDQIAAEAKAKIDELVKLQKQDEPQPGDWCVFWDNKTNKPFYAYNTVSKFKEKRLNFYCAENGFRWIHCRRITPEDFGWKLDNKPDWKDAPDWANHLAQDGNGGWWWYKNKPEPSTTD
jgi:hypothetical protein